ncbi:heat shock protein beta-1-like isoform X2 [Dendronephthya gigantea]|uniref:heat shock protein beta-1-like isoform X2 n=1 Tax=Dendronephthya gigantea TaxID=151771 RepID=UPI00106D4759|nr:heat shock protein beta-1-like isoform X2 [Dendronephthya gigantea]
MSLETIDSLFNSFYDESPSFADTIDEMFDMTFPPVRYRNPRYMGYQGNQSSTQQRQLQRSRSQDSNKLLIAQLDVSHYKPEEVSCKVENGKVLVSGKHYAENEYGYDASEFHRSYSLPEDTDPLSVKSRISQDGVLQIEAMKKCKLLSRDPALGVDETDDTKLSLKFNLAGYKPEEVNVRVKGKELMVSAEHKMEEEGHFTHRQFRRRISLPTEVDVNSLISRFGKDGVLSIEANKKPPPALEEKKIEIQQDAQAKNE